MRHPLTWQLLDAVEQIVQVLLVDLAPLAQRVDLADDVLVLARLREELLVALDELGDLLLELVVRRLLDTDLRRHLLEVLTELRSGRNVSERTCR